MTKSSKTKTATTTATVIQTKSDMIRALAAKGFENADIAEQLGLGYSHVYSVLNPYKSKKVTVKKTAAEQKAAFEAAMKAGPAPAAEAAE